MTHNEIALAAAEKIHGKNEYLDHVARVADTFTIILAAIEQAVAEMQSELKSTRLCVARSDGERDAAKMVNKGLAARDFAAMLAAEEAEG